MQRRTAASPLLALALLAGAAPGVTPAAAQTPTRIVEAPAPAHVRVTAHIVVVDRDAVSRAGLSYAVLGNDRVQLRSRHRGRGGTGVRVGTHGVTAFIDVARDRHWIRSESTQQVLALSGREAVVRSNELSLRRRGAARVRGPSLFVVPTVQPDGTVHMWVSTRIEDSVTYPWGYGVDGSPAAVDTELIARSGEELILASSSTVEASRETGLLRWSEDERGRDVLVTLTATVAPH